MSEMIGTVVRVVGPIIDVRFAEGGLPPLFSVVSVQAGYVPADDLSDPAAAAVFSHLDARTVLDRGIAALGIYPAVDPLHSASRILDSAIVGKRHY